MVPDQRERAGHGVSRVQQHAERARHREGREQVEERSRHAPRSRKRITAAVANTFAIESGRIIFQHRSMTWS